MPEFLLLGQFRNISLLERWPHATPPNQHPHPRGNSRVSTSAPKGPIFLIHPLTLTFFLFFFLSACFRDWVLPYWGLYSQIHSPRKSNKIRKSQIDLGNWFLNPEVAWIRRGRWKPVQFSGGTFRYSKLSPSAGVIEVLILISFQAHSFASLGNGRSTLLI
jgi:hypothetical protein